MHIVYGNDGLENPSHITLQKYDQLEIEVFSRYFLRYFLFQIMQILEDEISGYRHGNSKIVLEIRFLGGASRREDS